MTDAAGPDQTALAEVTSEVVAAYVAQNHLQPNELPNLIASVYAVFHSFKHPLEAALEPEELIPPVSIKKSVTNEYLISLEDGKRYQTLKRHLWRRGLTPAEYRAKWGLPHDYPMTSPSYAARRSELAKTTGLGQRANPAEGPELTELPEKRKAGRPKKGAA
ncbi:MAG: MucR family transcriptional regulator [Janthinobacterium lividum]